MKTMTVIRELQRILDELFPELIEKVFLYGSRAKGKPGVFSDYDILIVIKNNYDWKLEDQILSACYEIDLKFNIVTDVRLISRAELGTIKGRQPYILNAMQHGIHA